MRASKVTIKKSSCCFSSFNVRNVGRWDAVVPVGMRIRQVRCGGQGRAGKDKMRPERWGVREQAGWEERSSHLNYIINILNILNQEKVYTHAYLTYQRYWQM